MGLVDAIWVGPNGYTLADGTVLNSGETVVSISGDEASDSDNWLLASDIQQDEEKSTKTENTE